VTKITIAIDGPAASGKSTVGAALAAKLGYLYFDTGVMYRAVTWAALDRGISISDEEAVGDLAEILLIEVIPPTLCDGRQYTVLADQVDITWAIREPQVNRGVSPVSTYRRVRSALTTQQRRIGAPGAVVMVGRDIGTVVLPEAEVKVYLDATLQERTRRRFSEALLRGQALSYDDVLADLQRRDHSDSTRSEAPLSIAPGAVVIDTTHLSIGEVVEHIEKLVLQAIKRIESVKT
jgi:cytidylate kinase